MAAAASEKALASAGVRADEIDTVIVSTVTHLSQTPSAAAELAFRLGTRALLRSTSVPHAPDSATDLRWRKT